VDFRLTPGQAALREEVLAFLDAEHESFVPRCDNWLLGHDRELSRKLAARGWIGLTWPEEYGGAGRGYVDRLVAVEPLLAAGAPVASHWAADRQMGPSILAHGTAGQKERLLPPILAGEATYCIGMSEPEAGSDLANVRTRAVRDDDGFRVSGHKIWTSNAHNSDYIYLLARTGPSSERHNGLSELVVPMDAPGITVTPIRDMAGGSHFNEVFFEDARVGPDALIGIEGRGFYQITAQLGYERAGLERIMSVWPLLEKMRRVADTPSRRRELGDIESAIAAARLLVYRVAWLCDQGKVPDHEPAMAKALGTMIEQQIVELACRWAGRDGRLAPGTHGVPLGGHVSHAWRVAPSFSIRGGTTEILRGIVARRGLGLD